MCGSRQKKKNLKFLPSKGLNATVPSASFALPCVDTHDLARRLVLMINDFCIVNRILRPINFLFTVNIANGSATAIHLTSTIPPSLRFFRAT